MAEITNEDKLTVSQDDQDKDFNQWRQPKPPESPKTPEEIKSNSAEYSCVQKKNMCGVKDLSRLSRKRRAILSVKGARICSRKRSEDKPFGSGHDSKPRTSKKGRLDYVFILRKI